MKEWHSSNVVFRTIANSKIGKWKWVFNRRCKYITVRIDMRDGKCVIMDRDGKEITPEELEKQNV